MEARHKLKTKQKQEAKLAALESSSSDAEDLSDFEDAYPRYEAEHEDEEAPAKTYFTPEDKSRRLVVILDNASLETA